MTKRLGFVVAALIAVTAGLSLWPVEPGAEQAQEARTLPAAPSGGRALAEEVASLRAQMRRLREDQRAISTAAARARTRTDQLVAEGGTIEGEEPVSDTEEGAAASDPPTPQEEADLFTAYFARMDAIRSQEARDRQWENEVVERVQRVAAEDFEGAEVRHVECGSTLCRLRVAFGDPAERVLFAQTFHLRLGSALPQASIFMHPDEPVAEVYLAREGHELPYP